VDRSQILAPVPRRHLIQTSESQNWLQVPPVPTDFVSPTPKLPSGKLNHRLSFSSSIENRHLPSSIRQEKEKLDIEKEESSMGKRWVRWMHKTGMKGWVVPTAILGSTLVKWCVGLGPYSG
jgi:alpha-1,3-glucosyltransferase